MTQTKVVALRRGHLIEIVLNDLPQSKSIF